MKLIILIAFLLLCLVGTQGIEARKSKNGDDCDKCGPTKVSRNKPLETIVIK